jgi:hypothetical protein
MTELHIQYLSEIIEENGKHSQEAHQELAEIKAEFAAKGIFIA